MRKQVCDSCAKGNQIGNGTDGWSTNRCGLKQTYAYPPDWVKQITIIQSIVRESKCLCKARGYVMYSPRASASGRERSPRATQEGNKSHNQELKADNRLIFTLTRIPKEIHW